MFPYEYHPLIYHDDTCFPIGFFWLNHRIWPVVAGISAIPEELLVSVHVLVRKWTTGLNEGQWSYEPIIMGRWWNISTEDYGPMGLDAMRFFLHMENEWFSSMISKWWDFHKILWHGWWFVDLCEFCWRVRIRISGIVLRSVWPWNS